MHDYSTNVSVLLAARSASELSVGNGGLCGYRSPLGARKETTYTYLNVSTHTFTGKQRKRILDDPAQVPCRQSVRGPHRFVLGGEV